MSATYYKSGAFAGGNPSNSSNVGGSSNRAPSAGRSQTNLGQSSNGGSHGAAYSSGGSSSQRPSSAGATRSRTNSFGYNRGTNGTGVTNLFQQANQQHQQPTNNIPGSNITNAGGYYGQSYNAYLPQQQQQTSTQRPSSAGHARPSGSHLNNSGSNAVPAHFGSAIQVNGLLPSATNPQAYYQTNAYNPYNTNLSMAAQKQQQQQRPLSANATPSNGANILYATTTYASPGTQNVKPISLQQYQQQQLQQQQQAQMQAQQQQQQQQRPQSSSAASKLRQALDLSQKLEHTTGGMNIAELTGMDQQEVAQQLGATSHKTNTTASSTTAVGSANANPSETKVAKPATTVVTMPTVQGTIQATAAVMLLDDDDDADDGIDEGLDEMALGTEGGGGLTTTNMLHPSAVGLKITKPQPINNANGDDMEDMDGKPLQAYPPASATNYAPNHTMMTAATNATAATSAATTTAGGKSSHPEVSMTVTTPSQSLEFMTSQNTGEVRNTSLDSFSNLSNFQGAIVDPEALINIGLNTVPNQFCTKQDALELKKLLLLSNGVRGGIVPSSSAVMDMYMVGKVVGVGSYGKVRCAWHRLTGSKIAIKTYDKARLKDPAHWKRVYSEIKIMESISHPRISRLYEAVETPKRMHLIMECLDGGNLCSYVKAKRRLSEDEARKIFVQILQSIDYLHNVLSVAHRDVKLENVLFVGGGGSSSANNNANDANSQGYKGDVKLIDFGFSTVCPPGKKLKVFCGTPSYMAPEIVRRVEYEGKPVDIWSLGILLYALLCGCFPFRAKAYPDLYRRIARGTFAVPDELSPPVRDLLQKLLTVDPDQRVTSAQALKHPWLQSQIPIQTQNLDKLRQEMTILISEKPAEDIDEQVLQELVAFGLSKDEIVRLILSKTHASVATLYYLLLDVIVQKRRAQGIHGGPHYPSNNTLANSKHANNQGRGKVITGAGGTTGGASSGHYAQYVTGNTMAQTASNSNNANNNGGVYNGKIPLTIQQQQALMQQQQQQVNYSAGATQQRVRPSSANATSSNHHAHLFNNNNNNGSNNAAGGYYQQLAAQQGTNPLMASNPFLNTSNNTPDIYQQQQQSQQQHRQRPKSASSTNRTSSAATNSAAATSNNMVSTGAVLGGATAYYSALAAQQQQQQQQQMPAVTQPQRPLSAYALRR